MATLAVVVAIALVVVAAAFFGAVGGSTEITMGEGAGIAFEIPTDGSAIVSNKFQSGGLKLIRVQIQRPDYSVHIALMVPEDCIDDDGVGNRTLRADAECAELPISGPIDGGGITSEGDQIVMLRLTIDQACFEAVAIGSPWPSAEPACASS